MSADPPEGPQRPDYVAACEFLAFVSRYAVILVLAFTLSDRVRAGSLAFLGILFAAFWTSDVLWGFAARAMERRRGEPGRRVAQILGGAGQFWSVTALAAYLATRITEAPLPTLILVTVFQLVIFAAIGAGRAAITR